MAYVTGALGMIATALLLLGQPTVIPMSSQRTSDHVVSVSYDCTVVDETGDKLALKLIQSGRMVVAGEDDERRKTTTDVPFIEPQYQVVEGSNERFARMVDFAAKPRQIDWQAFVRSVDENGDFAALFQLIRHKLSSGIDPRTGKLSGLSMIMYMPRRDAPEQTETLGGVCVATRLEDRLK